MSKAMKTYYNNVQGKPVPTVGESVKLPPLDIEFAVVRPPYLGGHKDIGWQVIHVRTGQLITRTPERTKVLAIKRALARIEGQIAERGLERCQRSVKTSKITAIVKAYKCQKP